jgi:hypothetical protein
MAAVWRGLGKRKPIGSWKVLWGAREMPASAAEGAMVALLQSCVAHASCSNVIDTVAELQRYQRDYKEQAARLREEAIILRKRQHPGKSDEIEKQAKNLEDIAAWCEGEAAMFAEAETAKDAESPVIKRDKGWRREMGLSDMISDTMHWLYGSPHYGTTATLVNVITGKTSGRSGGGVVTAAHVRDWLKTLRIRRA